MAARATTVKIYVVRLSREERDELFIPKCRRKTRIKSYGGISEKCSASSRTRSGPRSRKGIRCPIMSTCCFQSRRNTRFRRWSASSRARARSTWPGLWSAQTQFRRAALLGARILVTRSGSTSRPSAPTSAIKKGRSEAGTVEPLALTAPPLGGSKFRGPRQRPLLPLRAADVAKVPRSAEDTTSGRRWRRPAAGAKLI